MFKSSFLLFAVVFAAFASAQQGSHPNPPSPTPTGSVSSGLVSVQRDVQYGTAGGEKLLLDLYLPEATGSRPRPAIVLIHGGGWISFDKSTMRGMGNVLARAGFVAVAVDYRLLHGAENRWPAQLDDVQRSVRWLRANANKYNIDPNHIGAFGHSSGAQLAALLGMEDTRDNSDPTLAKYSSRVQAVVDVSGPSDFLTNRDADGDAFLANFFGASYDKAPEVWRDASPISHVAKSDASFLIVHGTHDQSVPVAQAQELYEKLEQAGVQVSFVKLDDGHMFDNPENRKQLALETLTFFSHVLITNP